MTAGTKQDPWVLGLAEVTHHPRNNSMRAIRS
jgi:hypothetical protein